MTFVELDDLYRDVVLDHYKNPRGRCPLDRKDAENEGFNPVCGDEVRVALRVDNGLVTGAEVNGRGCSISVASGSMLAELLIGRKVADVQRLVEAFRGLMHGAAVADDIDLGDLEALEGVRRFPVRVKCAMLPWTTLADALKAYVEGERSGRPSSTEERSLGDRPNLTPSQASSDLTHLLLPTDEQPQPDATPAAANDGRAGKGGQP
jgi:nitrogen fixation NifU-like protein